MLLPCYCHARVLCWLGVSPFFTARIPQLHTARKGLPGMRGEFGAVVTVQDKVSGGRGGGGDLFTNNDNYLNVPGHAEWGGQPVLS